MPSPSDVKGKENHEGKDSSHIFTTTKRLQIAKLFPIKNKTPNSNLLTYQGLSSMVLLILDTKDTIETPIVGRRLISSVYVECLQSNLEDVRLGKRGTRHLDVGDALQAEFLVWPVDAYCAVHLVYLEVHFYGL